MTVFTRDQIREQLRARNVGEAAIERVLDREFGVAESGKSAPQAVVRETIALPFRLVVPWSLLCSDNEKEVGSLHRRGGEIYPRKVLSARYKTSKAAIQDKAKIVAAGASPTTEPLAIRVRVWLPPARRNDAINFSKVVHDAMEDVVYENDNQLHHIDWRRAGVDIDAPRAEIEITPLA